MYADQTGEAATKGQIHNWVVNDIVWKYSLIGMTTNFWISYPENNDYNRKYGIADLVCLVTGEVWEVKRFTVSMNSAEKQLDRYVSNIPYKTNYQGIDLVRGGSKGIYILPGIILRSEGNTTYFVYYWDCGNGIVYYNYQKFPTKDIETAVATGAAVAIGSYLFATMQSDGAPILVDVVCAE